MNEEQRVGQTIGPYAINDYLGQGGAAATYRAYDQRSKKQVAVRFFEPSVTGKEGIVHSLQNYVEQVKRCKHNGIAPTFTADTLATPAGTELALSQEYVGDVRLRQRISSAGLVPFDAFEVVTPIVEILAYAFDSWGLAHGNLHPNNIFLQDGQIVLTELGLCNAFFVHGHAKGAALRDPGFGNYLYTAPERFSGELNDFRSDYYSLGIILYELICGRTPFSGSSSLSVASAHRSSAPPDPMQLNPQLTSAQRAVLLRLLAKKPEERYQSAEELKRALLSAADVTKRGATSLFSGQESVMFANVRPKTAGVVPTVNCPLCGTTQPADRTHCLSCFSELPAYTPAVSPIEEPVSPAQQSVGEFGVPQAIPVPPVPPAPVNFYVPSVVPPSDFASASSYSFSPPEPVAPLPSGVSVPLPEPVAPSPPLPEVSVPPVPPVSDSPILASDPVSPRPPVFDPRHLQNDFARTNSVTSSSEGRPEIAETPLSSIPVPVVPPNPAISSSRSFSGLFDQGSVAPPQAPPPQPPAESQQWRPAPPLEEPVYEKTMFISPGMLAQPPVHTPPSPGAASEPVYEKTMFISPGMLPASPPPAHPVAPVSPPTPPPDSSEDEPYEHTMFITPGMVPANFTATPGLAGLPASDIPAVSQKNYWDPPATPNPWSQPTPPAPVAKSNYGGQPQPPPPPRGAPVSDEEGGHTMFVSPEEMQRFAKSIGQPGQSLRSGQVSPSSSPGPAKSGNQRNQPPSGPLPAPPGPAGSSNQRNRLPSGPPRTPAGSGNQRNQSSYPPSAPPGPTGSGHQQNQPLPRPPASGPPGGSNQRNQSPYTPPVPAPGPTSNQQDESEQATMFITPAARIPGSAVPTPPGISSQPHVPARAGIQHPSSPVQPASSPASSQSFKYCSNCGKPMKPNAKFCTLCGKPRS